MEKKILTQAGLEKLENELKLGPSRPVKDEDGYEYTPHSARDYMFYAYPDYQSREYDVFMLKRALHMLYEDYQLKDKGYEPVIILSQG